MLFEFEKGLVSASAACGFRWDIVERFLLAHADGMHILLLPPDMASAVQNGELSPRAKATAQRIDRSISQLAPAKDAVNRYVLVTADPGACSEVQAGATKYWCVPLSRFADSRSTRETALVGEDLNDLDLWEFLLEAVAPGLPSAGLKCRERHHGGGDRIGTVIHERRTDRRLICVITDGDRDSSSEGPGQTAGRAAAALDGYDMPHELLVSACREVENVVPPRAWAHLFEGDANCKERRDALLSFNGRFEFRFLDLKEGTPCSLGRLIIGCNPADCPVTAAGMKSVCSCSTGEHYFCPRIGSAGAVLDRVRGMPERDRRTLKRILRDDLDAEDREILHAIASWAAGAGHFAT
jgi:hypothetical protein